MSNQITIVNLDRVGGAELRKNLGQIFSRLAMFTCWELNPNLKIHMSTCEVYMLGNKCQVKYSGVNLACEVHMLGNKRHVKYTKAI